MKAWPGRHRGSPDATPDSPRAPSGHSAGSCCCCRWRRVRHDAAAGTPAGDWLYRIAVAVGVVTAAGAWSAPGAPGGRAEAAVVGAGWLRCAVALGSAVAAVDARDVDRSRHLWRLTLTLGCVAVYAVAAAVLAVAAGSRGGVGLVSGAVVRWPAGAGGDRVRVHPGAPAQS